MSKLKQERRLPDFATRAVLRSATVSPQKARLVLDMVRGKHVSDALNILAFSNKAIARDVHKLLQSAIANAENNHHLNVDKLFVTEAFADKSFTIKRWHARARGRGAKVMKPRSHLTVVVADVAAGMEEGVA